MEEKKIIGVISAIILVITASFLKSKKISKSQKVVLFMLIIFPPAQWVIGIIFIVLNKKKVETKSSKINSIKTTEGNSIESNYSKKNNNLLKLKEKTINLHESFSNKIELLNKSLEMKLISKTEYDTKIKNIEIEKKKIECQIRAAEKKISNSEKFEKSKKTLKNLYDNQIINKEEFESKIQEQKKTIYDIEEVSDIKSDKKVKNKTTEKNIMLAFLTGLVILLISIFINKSYEPSNIKSDLYYENQIQFFLTAETQEDFLEVIDYIDLNNVSRCWSILNPTYDELNFRYQKYWRESKHISLSINFINKKQSRVFETNIDYQSFNEEEKVWQDINRTIRFVFGENNKIIEVYEIM